MIYIIFRKGEIIEEEIAKKIICLEKSQKDNLVSSLQEESNEICPIKFNSHLFIIIKKKLDEKRREI